MTKVIHLKTSADQAVRDLCAELLQHKLIGGVFSLRELSDDHAVAYSLITDPAELKSAVPFYPLMPVNAGKLLSRFTLKGSPKQPIVAILKPCELRGFAELIKREQGSTDNLILISHSCGGVLSSQKMVTGEADKHLASYWKSVKNNEIPTGVRTTCRCCEEFLPYQADITIDFIGNTDFDTTTPLYIHTTQAEQLLSKINQSGKAASMDTKKIKPLLQKRTAEKTRLFADLEQRMNGIDGLVEIFGRCIGCHGCSKVCPICYCKLCEFESPDAEYDPSNFVSELKRKQGIRVPPGTLYFHLGRMAHIGLSCVACGACEDVCPVDIPIALIFKKVGESMQHLFKYVPGKDINEPLPLVTFENEEFCEVEK